MKKTIKNDSLLKNLTKLWDALLLYFPSAYGGWENRQLWQNINTYCLFIGYSRSGHSLIGALLNAHPNIVIAHELNDLKYTYLGFRRWQLYHLLLDKAKLGVNPNDKSGGYNYDVPNQWQGKFTQILVIGDKKGEGTTLKIEDSPLFLQRLRKIINVKIKFIHIIRNPYDNITTMSKKNLKLDFHLSKSIEYYFFLCNIVNEFKKTLKSDEIYELKYELFIENPKVYLEEICNFLGVSTTKSYLEDCANIVYKFPNKSRYSIVWTSELIEEVQNRINHYSFLHGYNYND